MSYTYKTHPSEVIKRVHSRAVYAVYETLESYPYYSDDVTFYLPPDSEELVGVADEDQNLLPKEECNNKAWAKLSHVDGDDEDNEEEQLQPSDVLARFGFNTMAWDLVKSGYDESVGSNPYSVPTLIEHPYLLDCFDKEDFKRIDDEEALLEAIGEDIDLDSLLTNLHTPSHLLERLLTLFPIEDGDDELLQAIFEHPNASCELFAQSQSFEVRGAVSIYNDVSFELLDRLAEDENMHVRFNVALHVNTPLNTLKKLAKDSYNSVRRAVISHPNISAEVLETLVQDTDKEVRRRIASNPHTSLELLQSLMTDEDQDVRGAVARNPKTPLELLRTLATDEAEVVRYVVAENPNTSLELLKTLAIDKDKRVGKSA